MDGPKVTATGCDNKPGQDGITDKWQVYSRARRNWLDVESKFAAFASANGNKIRLISKEIQPGKQIN